MPTRVSGYNPQLATLSDTAPSGSEWIHELKYDGYPIGAVVSGASVRLESRREIDWTPRFRKWSRRFASSTVERP